MSKFEEMSFDGKCDICGKETKVVACVSSEVTTSLKVHEHEAREEKLYTYNKGLFADKYKT